jgi:hypothetical protein
MVTHTPHSAPAVRRLRALVSSAALLLCAVVPASAQVVFTVTATANANAVAGGYTQGQSYTFTFTSAASFANTSSSTYTSVANSWSEETVADGQMWTSIGGTGVTGTFVRPVGSSTNPYSYAYPSSEWGLGLGVGSDSTTDLIGLSTLSNQGFKYLSVSSMSGGTMPSFTTSDFTEAYVEPFNSSTGFFATKLWGSFTGLTSGTVEIGMPDDATFYTFAVTGLSVGAVSAVPEPSTYAALAGLAAFGLVLLRRRRANAA